MCEGIATEQELVATSAWIQDSCFRQRTRSCPRMDTEVSAEHMEWKHWYCAALVVKKVGGTPPDALVPWICNLLDGQAALALESIEIKDMCVDGGEEFVFWELDHRFPDKVATDRMAEAWRGPLD